MSTTIIIFLVVLLIPVVLGLFYFSRHMRKPPGGPDTKNGTPVTLDRSPEMPKMPGATS